MVNRTRAEGNLDRTSRQVHSRLSSPYDWSTCSELCPEAETTIEPHIVAITPSEAQAQHTLLLLPTQRNKHGGSKVQLGYDAQAQHTRCPSEPARRRALRPRAVEDPAALKTFAELCDARGGRQGRGGEGERADARGRDGGCSVRDLEGQD